MKKYFIPFVLVMSLVLALAAPAIAADFVVGEEVGISEDFSENLYAAGGMLRVAGNVVGDFVGAGGQVSLSGNVTEDVLIVGGEVDVDSVVGGDLRLAAGEVVITEDVNGDVVIAGGTVRIAGGTSVNGDLVIGAGQVVLDGDVNGDVLVGAGQLLLSGSVSGNVKAYVEELSLGNNAVISGDLYYTALEELELREGAVGGEVTFDQSKRPDDFLSEFNFDWIKSTFSLVGLVFLILVTMFVFVLFPRTSNHVSKVGVDNFGISFVTGFVAFIATPIAAFLLMISFFGLYIGGLLGVSYVVLLFLGKIAASIVAGSFFYQHALKQEKFVVTWHSALVGVALLHFVKLVPYIGWIATFVFGMVGIGALLQAFYRGPWAKR